MLVPIACTTLAISASSDYKPHLRSASTNVNPVSRGFITYYYSSFGLVENMSSRILCAEQTVHWGVLYTSLILSTLLWCTILIVYRILRVGGLTAGMRVHHRLIEMLVESASFYSVVIVILLVFEVRNEVAGVYIEEFAIATRVSTTNSFYLFLPSYYNVSAREWCQQFWSAALQQAMRAQTTPGAKTAPRRRFDSEITQVRRLTALKWVLDMSRTYLRA